MKFASTNTYVTIHKSNFRGQRWHYLAVYNRKTSKYIGTMTFGELCNYCNTHKDLRLDAYVRISNVTRGRTGRYEVTHDHNGFYRNVHIKNKRDAFRSIYWERRYGHYVRIVDLETGEILFEGGAK